MVNIGLGRVGGIVCVGESDLSDTSDRSPTDWGDGASSVPSSVDRPNPSGRPAPGRGVCLGACFRFPGSRRLGRIRAPPICSVRSARRLARSFSGRGRCLVSSFAVVYASCRLSAVVVRLALESCVADGSSLTGSSSVGSSSGVSSSEASSSVPSSTTSSSTTTASPRRRSRRRSLRDLESRASRSTS